ncbi:unnamed protein product, partial [Ixodes pacificus]
MTKANREADRTSGVCPVSTTAAHPGVASAQSHGRLREAQDRHRGGHVRGSGRAARGRLRLLHDVGRTRLPREDPTKHPGRPRRDQPHDAEARHRRARRTARHHRRPLGL